MKILPLICALCLWVVSPALASEESCPMDQGAWVYSQCVDQAFGVAKDYSMPEEFASQESPRPLSGGIQQYGEFGYSTWSDGTTGTSQRIGPDEYYNFSDGTDCYTTTISGYTYVTCQ